MIHKNVYLPLRSLAALDYAPLPGDVALRVLDAVDPVQ